MSAKEMAVKIDKIVFDSDPYEYWNCIEDSEKFKTEIETAILNKDIDDILHFLMDIIENKPSDDLVEQAEQIKEELNNLSKRFKQNQKELNNLL